MNEKWYFDKFEKQRLQKIIGQQKNKKLQQQITYLFERKDLVKAKSLSPKQITQQPLVQEFQPSNLFQSNQTKNQNILPKELLQSLEKKRQVVSIGQFLKQRTLKSIMPVAASSNELIKSSRSEIDQIISINCLDGQRQNKNSKYQQKYLKNQNEQISVKKIDYTKPLSSHDRFLQEQKQQKPIVQVTTQNKKRNCYLPSRKKQSVNDHQSLSPRSNLKHKSQTQYKSFTTDLPLYNSGFLSENVKIALESPKKKNQLLLKKTSPQKSERKQIIKPQKQEKLYNFLQLITSFPKTQKEQKSVIKFDEVKYSLRDLSQMKFSGMINSEYLIRPQIRSKDSRLPSLRHLIKRIIKSIDILKKEEKVLINKKIINHKDRFPYQKPHSIQFIHACKDGDIDSVLSLLTTNKYLVYDFDYYNMTGLHWACMKNQVQIAQILINYDANIEAVDILKRTPLYVAISQENDLIVRLLLFNKAYPFSTSKTPLKEILPEFGIIKSLVQFSRRVGILEIQKLFYKIHIALWLAPNQRREKIWRSKQNIFNEQMEELQNIQPSMLFLRQYQEQ